MKLIIQIPCLNERDHLGATFADLPRVVAGVDEVEVLVIDDGSTDGTAARAFELGVHHVVRFPTHRGLSAAFMAGLDASLRLGADIIVNTDADNQYVGEDIARLVAPILDGRADIVVGDRELEHFSPWKRRLQRWGSRVVRHASATRVVDSTCGFRAFTRAAACRMFVHNRFTYTVETIIQAGRGDWALESVKIRTNPVTRGSRLFRSIPEYVRRNGPVILRSYWMYRPVQTVTTVAGVLFFLGLVGIGRFFYYYLRNPSYSGHVQSVLLSVGAVIVAFLLGLVAMLSELTAGNRRLIEELLYRVRRLDAETARNSQRQPTAVDGVESSGVPAWRRQSWS